jgi:DNA mismatch repair protein MutS
VIERAKVVLEALESGERAGGSRQKALIDDLPLFRAAPAAAPVKVVAQSSEVEALLRQVHPDELTPKQALALVYELREKLKP